MPEVCSKLSEGEEDFASCPNISIDYGIMEKANNVFVQLCDFGWADLGTWSSLYDVAPKDENENVAIPYYIIANRMWLWYRKES